MYIGNTSGVGTGTVTVADGGRIELGGDGVLLRDGNLFTGDGSVKITSAAGLFSNAGILRPGLLDGDDFSGGTFNLEGDYTQTSTGVLDIRLGGIDGGDFGVLEVTDGTVTLGGTLSVLLANDFLLGYNQFFHVLRLDGDSEMSGQFLGLDENGLVGTFNGVDLYITYNAELYGMSTGGVGLFTAIPEPRTYAMLFGVVVVLASMLRRRR